ncbi:beta-1,4-mannosyl-glycoprotein 4-beta-N-acetylglucosaminyltransferase [Eurytemora carolleeae]|uniref:beta-1,4-mannosyl-glycoprotein 4-beta-N-acetylglucosaminyltransferase n=1 Tax=Eurytemora carolleeae TaxID=1294199 RepID=UPI000C76A3D7|nr:beta-1,4-mannosyl-glycoprotein 4-beta-N-acetylglucosaminyltransferase [Eurytemora carolleeae]|eukprot:XP_023319480.1 beta-1,4-mannosyl-glycoprotein 4-beta-N-acetylglucosaminyltransferase-like [Eurytemora affinis]
MHYHIVDIFFVQESSFSNSGGNKPLLLLEKLQCGWLNQFQDKLIYIFRNDTPTEGFENGVLADADMRRFISREGLNLVPGIEKDDLFIYNDGDELISSEILLFLKLYDGIPNIIAIKYIWAIYGFFWRIQEFVFPHQKHFEPAVLTMQFFRDFYNCDASQIRSANYLVQTTKVELYKKQKKEIGPLNVINGGWHCSWCFTPQGIRQKLIDAPKSDYPRFGDFPGKTDVSYIRKLIKEGVYFDLSRFRNTSEISLSQDPAYAPPFIIQNKERFHYLLLNPYTITGKPQFTTANTNGSFQIQTNS